MLRPPRTSSNKAAIVFSASLVHLWCGAAAQNITLQLGNVDPLGLADFMPGESPLKLGSAFGMEDGFKGDLSYGLAVKSIYDSNFTLTDDNPESEFSSYITPWLDYRSDPEGGAPFSISANYSPSMRAYVENSDLNDIDQSASVNMLVRGAKTNLSFYVRYNELSGSDRLTGEFVQGSIFYAGVDGSYQIAPRTSLVGSLSGSMSDYQSSSLVGAEIYTAQIGALWDATGKFSLGPAFRYMLTQSDNSGQQNAWALLMNTRYRAGERVQLLTSAGVEYARSTHGEEDSSLRFTGALTGVYAVTPRLAWSNSIVYGTVPSANQTNFLVQNLAVTSSLARQLTWGSLEAGLTLNISNYEEVGEVTSNPGIQENFSPYVGYRRNFFLERLAFESQLRYTVNRGQVDWSQVQLSVGLQMQF